MHKRVERLRIMGIIEMVRDEMGESTYEKYARKKLDDVLEIIEYNS